MGKKQKNVFSQKQKTINIEIDQQENMEPNKANQNDKVSKLSKKERRKMKKDIKRGANNNSKVKSTEKTDEQEREQQQQQIEVQVVQEQIAQDLGQESKSLIEINSQEIEEQYGNEIEFNPRGRQGFDELINQIDDKSINQVKSIEIKRNTSGSQSSQTYYFYHIKKQTFYKTTSLNHQKVNLTHLNENICLKIVDQNLMKNANQQSSTSFFLNGKLIPKQITFIKSTVFKVVSSQTTIKQPVKTNSKDKKKFNQNNSGQRLKENIQSFIKPSTAQQTQQVIEFLRDFDWKQDCLLICKEKLILIETTAPFANVDSKMLASNNSLLILGKKNTGKSTLAEYLKNIKPSEVCILDCDIGRSLSVSGCVSLLTQQQNINIWIGEFTPFNCIGSYVKAIEKLYQLYRQKYFSQKLIINTMGYLSGVGQMVIYQIYNLINPSEIIVLNSQNQNTIGNDNISNILKNIKTGTYLTKLLTLSSQEHCAQQLRKFNQKRLSLNIQYIDNEHAQGKGIPIRFQNLLMYKKNFKNVVDLIKSIKKKEFQKISNLTLYQQDKLGNILKLDSSERKYADMRIVLIGKWFQKNSNSQLDKIEEESELFRIFGIGYGFQGEVYFSKEQIQNVLSPNTSLKEEKQNLRGILSEGVDFQKNFYLINELNLIDLQLEYGDVPYIMPIIKGMGSKGTRNNPSKKA